MEESQEQSISEATGGSIPVGVLFSQSGPMALTESGHLKGTLVAIDEINSGGGINGRKIEPIIVEPASDLRLYKELATKLLVKDRVSVIFGCCSSASRKVVLPLVERFGVLLFYPSFYEGFEYSPNIIYTGATPNQTVLPLAEYLFNTHGRRFFLVGSDYIYPREINRILKEFLTESGGSAVGEVYLTLGIDTGSFQAAASQAKNSGADVILSTIVGSDTPKLYEACSKVGIDPAIQPIASLTTSECELAEIHSEARAGHITGASYFQSLDTDTNNRFKALYAARYGAVEKTCIYSETAYFQVHLFAKALRMTENDSPEILLKSLSGMRHTAPQGDVTVDADNNHLFVTPRIAISNTDGSFNVVWESDFSVKPDPYLIAYDRTIPRSTVG
ncbi:MAG: transporter substrate-binding domain-containing protein [Sedimenticola sp.]